MAIETPVVVVLEGLLRFLDAFLDPPRRIREFLVAILPEMREDPATLRPSELPTLHEVLEVLDAPLINLREVEKLRPMPEAIIVVRPESRPERSRTIIGSHTDPIAPATHPRRFVGVGDQLGLENLGLHPIEDLHGIEALLIDELRWDTELCRRVSRQI